MKRLMIIAAWLCGMAAVAQTANVGVNTRTPESTLDVRATKAADSETTNEGILAPRLTKTRVANIALPVEGTLVYVTDVTYTGSNVKVAKVTEKGYYFYNGTEWVKVITPDDPSKWQNDAANTLVKLKNLSNGTTSRTDATNILVKDNGNVGIGTDLAIEKLVIDGNVFIGKPQTISTNTYPQAGPYLAFEGTNTFSGAVSATPKYRSNSDMFAFYRYDTASDVSQFRLIIGDNPGTGDVFVIGLQPNSYQYSSFDSNLFSGLFRFDVFGNASKTTGASWNTLSDARTKDNITPYNRGLKELLQIKPIWFSYKKELGIGDRQQVGVLAQDLEKVVPSMVITTSEKVGDHENIKQVDGNEYTFMLINAVKELQQEVEALKAEIKTLKK